MRKETKKDKTKYSCYTRLYTIWADMKRRCRNDKHIGVKGYGQRGITYTKRWEVYKNFCDDMLESYNKHVEEYGEDNTSIDRVDVNGNYVPSNCRWATRKEQGSNLRNNRNITYKGETHTITEWSRILGINKATLADRLDKGNWSIEKAFTTPIADTSKYYTVDGITLNISGLAKKYNMKYSVVKNRLRRGWDIHKALKTPSKINKKRMLKTKD